MKLIRTTVAGVTLAIMVPAALAGCGSQPAVPTAAPTPSGTPSATAPASPGSTPAPAQTPTGTPGPSIRVVSSRITYPWHWPNDAGRPGRVTHVYQVPPVPEL